MTTKQISVQRFSVTSSKSIEEVVANFEATVSRPNMGELLQEIISAKTYVELEQVILKVIGRSGFMEFIRFDLGEIVRKERGKEAPQSLHI